MAVMAGAETRVLETRVVTMKPDLQGHPEHWTIHLEKYGSGYLAVEAVQPKNNNEKHAWFDHHHGVMQYLPVLYSEGFRIVMASPTPIYGWFDSYLPLYDDLSKEFKDFSYQISLPLRLPWLGTNPMDEKGRCPFLFGTPTYIQCLNEFLEFQENPGIYWLPLSVFGYLRVGSDLWLKGFHDGYLFHRFGGFKKDWIAFSEHAISLQDLITRLKKDGFTEKELRFLLKARQRMKRHGHVTEGKKNKAGRRVWRAPPFQYDVTVVKNHFYFVLRRPPVIIRGPWPYRDGVVDR